MRDRLHQLAGLVVPAFLLALVLVAGVAQAQDGTAILREVDQIRAPADDFGFSLHVQDASQRLVLDVRVRDRSNGVVSYEEPATSKGRKILFVGRNMWTYIPGTRRPVRISPQQQILGGVSSAEVARVVFSDDYAVTGVGVSEDADTRRAAEGGRALKLDLVASGSGAAYQRGELHVAAVSHRPLKAVFLSGAGKPLKTLVFEGYQTVLGRSRPMRLTIIEHIRGNARTTMTYSGMRLVETPAAWFNPDYLERIP